MSIGHRDEHIERKVDDMKLEVKPKSKLVNFNDFIDDEIFKTLKTLQIPIFQDQQKIVFENASTSIAGCCDVAEALHETSIPERNLDQ